MPTTEATGRLPLARDLMVSRVVTVAPEGDLLEGANLLLRNRISGAPVVASDGGYLGVLSERRCMRLLTAAARDGGDAAGETPARQFMTEKLVTLEPDMDAVAGVALLLEHRFSGAPVVDAGGRFLGVFSERYVMRLLVHAAHDGVPSPTVGAYMNTDRGRIIGEETGLLAVAQLFLDSYYRRLPVLRDERLVGQVSHRDVLRAAVSATSLPAMRIADAMSTDDETIAEDTDLLTIAQIFLESNRRRLPVLAGGRLVGQVSRRDVLAAALDLLAPEPHHESGGLYLSAVMDRNERPLLNRADYNREWPGRRPAGPADTPTREEP